MGPRYRGDDSYLLPGSFSICARERFVLRYQQPKTVQHRHGGHDDIFRAT